MVAVGCARDGSSRALATHSVWRIARVVQQRPVPPRESAFSTAVSDGFAIRASTE